MFSLGDRYAETFFERRGADAVFFPYGAAWPGYQVTADFRERLQPLIGTYVELATGLFMVNMGLGWFLGTQAALDLTLRPALVMLGFYLMNVFVLTRGLPAVQTHRASGQVQWLRQRPLSRTITLWIWYVLFAASALMSAASLPAIVLSLFGSQRHLWTALQGAGLFGLCSMIFLGELRIARFASPPEHS